MVDDAEQDPSPPPMTTATAVPSLPALHPPRRRALWANGTGKDFTHLWFIDDSPQLSAKGKTLLEADNDLTPGVLRAGPLPGSDMAAVLGVGDRRSNAGLSAGTLALYFFVRSAN